MKIELLKLIQKLSPVIAIAMLSAILFGQNVTGELSGEVSTLGPDGNPSNLPGATLVLRNKSNPPEKITTVSDLTGAYRIQGLKPGNYILKVSLSGFLTIEKTVVIASGQKLSKNIVLELDGISASVDVDIDNTEIDTTETTVSETIKQKSLQVTPLKSEKFEDALPLVPGVIRGPDGLINIKGASSSQSATLVGSSNGDDPVTGNTAVDLPLEAVQSVKVIANPYSAEFGSFNGGVVKVETQAGSDKWKFGLNNFIPRLRSRGGSIRGIESATPRVNFGGPLKKDKVFFFQAFEYRFVQTEVESLPDLEKDKKLESFNSFTRADINISDLNRLDVSLAIYPQKLDFINLDTFNPQNTAANLHQRGFVFSINDQHVSADGAIFTSFFSAEQTDADVFGNSSDIFSLAPRTNSGGFFNRQKRETTRYQTSTTYSLPTYEKNGQHLFKFGASYNYTEFDGPNTNQNLQVLRNDETINQIQSYVGNGILSKKKREVGGFVLDKWTMNSRITLELGIRFDRNSISKEINSSPRVGFVIAPFNDSKTVIRGGAGIFFSKVPLNVGAFDQYQDVQITRFAADGFTPLGSTFFENIIEDDDIDTPYSMGWNVELNREISERLFIKVGYEQHETRRNFILNRFLGSSPGNGRYILGNGGSASYRELVLMARVRLQKDRNLFFSYTRSRTAGDLNTFETFAGNIPNPIVRANEYSRLAFDNPNRFLFWGEIGMPFGITFAPVVDWHSGFPYSVIDENRDFIGRRNSGRRLPNFFSTDLQVFKNLNVRFRKKKYKLQAGVKFFNITNHFNPRDIQNNIDSTEFGGLFNGVGRKLRLKLKVIF